MKCATPSEPMACWVAVKRGDARVQTAGKFKGSFEKRLGGRLGMVRGVGFLIGDWGQGGDGWWGN